MKRTTFQHPELRDANDNIIQEGTYGKESPLVNSDNTGVLDYINNNLEALYDNINGGTGGEINTETITGKTGAITNLTATTVKAGTLTADALNGPLTGNVKGDLNGNVTGNVTGNADTATNATNDSNGDKIDTTYMPIAGGTFTGVVNGVTPTAGDNSTKIATTEFVNAKAGNYLPLSGGNITGNLTIGNKEVERVTTKSTNYIRYESGLQICWGYVSVNANTATNTTPFAYRGTVTTTFPVAFNSTPFGVSNVDDGSPWWTTTARSITSTTMQVEASGDKSATKDVYWFAVGKWK